MHRKVLTVREDDDLALALQMMSWTEERHLPVVRDGEVVGVINERDVFAYMAGEKGRESLTDMVGLAMSRPAKTIAPDAEDADAASVMTEKKVACLPVIEKGSLVGLVTLADIAAEQARGGLAAGVAQREPITSVMTRDPKTARPDDRLADAVSRMVHTQVRHLPVVDADRRVVGMLSDRDVRAAVGDPRKALEEGAARARLEELTVGQVMTREVAAVREQDTIGEVLGWFLGTRRGAVTVVGDDSKLVGIVSYVDLLRGLSPKNR